MTSQTKFILAGLTAGFLLLLAGYIDAALVLFTIGIFVLCIDIGDK